MKKLILILAVAVMMLPACKKINEALESLDGRLDKLEQEKIPSIDEQVIAINTTLSNLDVMDKELEEYIDDLSEIAINLQEQINSTNTKIAEVEIDLQSEISTSKAEVISQLEAVKKELEDELAQINATIVILQTKDAELDQKIADLNVHIDTELGETADWVNATFATLEQYNALVLEVTTIKEQIKTINQSIADLETRLTTKISEDIATAVSTLNTDIQQKVEEITEAYTAAVTTAKEEIAIAYTTAIQTAISTLDISLKAWVGEELSNYYTIAEVEAKIIVLQTAITEGDVALQEELVILKSQLKTTAEEITIAYKNAIEVAINTNNGTIDTKIANEIASVNQRINNEVAAINAKIAEIESRLDNVEAKIAELLARIQSVSYIPAYDDGKATVVNDGATSSVTLDFEVSPKDAVVELAKVWKNTVSVKAVYTQTRAVSFVDMPIVKFESDVVNGIISITASAENLSADFFDGIQSASARLSISDGNNTLTSEYVSLCAGASPQTNIVFEDLYVKAICCKYWDTNCDGELSYTEAAAVVSIGYYFSNNEYIVSFPEFKYFTGIDATYSNSFSDCPNLWKIELPEHLTAIGHTMFYNCSSLTSIVLPETITTIDFKAFYNTNIKSVVLPRSVTSIGESAFDTRGDLDIYCKAETPPAVYYYANNSQYQTGIIEFNSFYNINIYVPAEYYDLYLAFGNWSKYTSYLRPYNFNE